MDSLNPPMRSITLFTLALVSSCGSGTNDASKDPRLVLIGIDSADWTILDPMIEAGDLPHFADLKSKGASGNLRTLSDIPLSPVVWTSVATGKVPAKHGVTWFLVDQPDGTRTPVRSTNRKTEALWTITDRSGKKAYSLGWWATYPAESLKHGIIASDALGFHGFGSTARSGVDAGKVSPDVLFPRLDAMMPTEQQIGLGFAQRFMDITADDWERERFNPAVSGRRNPFSPVQLFQQYAVTAQGYTNIAKSFLEEDEYDLALFYYEQTDSFSHLFMKYEEPKLGWVDTRGFERYSRVVREWYRYQDELLGELLERIDLETTAVMIVSDHGFKTGERRIRSEKTVDVQKAHLDHEEQGIFLAAGPGFAQGATISGASVLDITPTVLHYLGLPVGKDMDGRVLSEAFTEGRRAIGGIEYVATHETGAPKTYDVPLPDAGPSNRADLEAGLRALGYLGAEDTGDSAGGDGASGEATAPTDVSSPEIHNNLGRIYLGQGDIDKALAEFESALRLDPNHADALLAIGSVHQIQGRTEVAVHFAERALAVNPNSVGALATLAGVRRDQGDLKDAARLYREALAMTDAQPQLFVAFGDVLLRAGNPDGALQQFARALELDPDDRAAHYNRGVVLGEQGRVAESIACYEKAIELDPGHPQAAFALNNLGAIYRDRGEVDKALENFEAAAERFAGHIESRFNAGMVHLERGDTEAAIVRFREAAAIEPNHELIQQQLGLALLTSGDAEGAYLSLLTVRRLYPKNWRAALGLAAIQSAQGNDKESKALLESGLALGGPGARAFAKQLGLVP